MTRTDRTLRALREPRQDRRRKVGTSALLLLALFAGLIGFAPGAFAHHAYVQGNAAGVCDPATGDIDVNFEVRSWGEVSDGDRVLNDSIGIQYRVGATATFPDITSPITGFSGDVATGAFTDNNSGGTPSLTGTFTLDASAGGQYVQLRAYPKGTWINAAGNSTQAPNPEGDDSFTVTIASMPTGCTPPATPSATAAAACQANAIVTSFTGVGSATTADISKNGAVIASGHPVPVGPSSFNVPLVAADENTTVTIGLDYAATSATDQSLQVPIDCQTPAAPSADVVWECGTAATVTLGNGGQESITATISKNGTPVVTDVAVPPGGTTLDIDIDADDENTDVTITVTFSDAGSATDVTEVLTIDCETPEPSVDEDIVCAAGGLELVLHNGGDDTASFTISSPALPGGADEATVAAGESATILLPLAEGAATDVLVTSDDEVLLEATLTRDCETVSPETVTPVPAPQPSGRQAVVAGRSSLARTGVDTAGLVSLAGVLLLAGVVLVAGGRRRPEAPVS